MDDIKFDLPQNQSSIIKVIGVGGGGSNAVNHMYNQGIRGVDFIVCNTDQQALDASPIPTKIQLGASLTSGRGAGSNPEVGKNAAIENIDDVKALLEKNTNMVFITAGMGGGTGTGAAPIIAKAAKELGILTVGIVTYPFSFEGKKRASYADNGLAEIRASVDTLIVIRNDKLREIYGNLSLKSAFGKADDILTTAAKGIAELISVHGEINVDMNDVITVMKDSGVALMGSAISEGEGRAIKAITSALESPLLNDSDIRGASDILLNITFGTNEVTMDEVTEITDYLQQSAGISANVIWGYGQDENLGESLSVTVIATGFEGEKTEPYQISENNLKKHQLEQPQMREISKPMSSPLDEDTKTTVAEPFLKSVQPEKTQAQLTFEEGEEKEVKDQPTFSQPFLKKVDDKIISESKEDTITTENQEIKKHYLNESSCSEDEDISVNSQIFEPSSSISQEEIEQRRISMMERIRKATSKLKNPNTLNEYEKEPAYLRRKINLTETPHSSESEISRYNLIEEDDENGNKRTEIKPNNSFLHDNVD